MTHPETPTATAMKPVTAPEPHPQPSFAIGESAELAAEIKRIESDVQAEVNLAKQRELERLREVARYD